MSATKTVALLLAVAACAQGARAQLRVAQWNITNWQDSTASPSSRRAAFKSAFYDVAPNGLRFAPDLLIAEEIMQGGTGNTAAHQSTGQNNVNFFVSLLNTASGSPGDWAAATYMANGGDTGNALFYRTSKFVVFNSDTVALSANTGTGSNQPPRDDQRWHARLSGYTGTGADLYLYGCHFKAGGTNPADNLRRVPEGLRLRQDANALTTANPGIGGFILGADFNIWYSSDQCYQYLVAYPGPSPEDVHSGQFLDPINSPAPSPNGWNNNSAFRFIHTQEPSTQMDDRHDQLLVSGALLDHEGLSYIFSGTTITASNPYGVPTFSTSTWNDPNHTYRCWGNDGESYNAPIRTTANTEVGPAIAAALVTTVSGNGHLPVYMDLQVPAKLGAPSGTINLGTVVQNSAASYVLQIANVADLARFSKDDTGAGIDSLTYSLAISSGAFSLAGGGGPFERPATNPAQVNIHTVTVDTSATGDQTATLTILSDDPDDPSRVLTLVVHVDPPAPTTGACCISGACTITTEGACGGDYHGDGSECTAALCPAPTGACCGADGGCAVTTQVQCTAVGYRGDNTDCAPGLCPQPAACCTAATGACVLVLQAECPTGDWNGAAACSPNPCSQPLGACCVGVLCAYATQAACTGAFQGPGSACGAAGNPTTCCPANFNGLGGVTVQDIFDFLAAWFALDPSADFNASGSITVQDIFDFLAAWFTGC